MRMSRKMNYEIIENSIAGSGRIDRTARQLKDITILSLESNNIYVRGTKGTKFTETARQSLVNLSEGTKVFFDHPGEKESRDNRGVRSIKDLAGYLEGSYMNSEGLVKSNFRYLKKDAENIEDIASTMPLAVGFSIHGFGPIHKNGEFGIVESFTSLPSVDFVSNITSRGGIFESNGSRQTETEN